MVHYDIVKFLVLKGADVKLLLTGLKVLDVAALKGREEIVDLQVNDFTQ